MPFDSSSLALVAITFVAAIANGGLGYGFSSLTVPIALLFLPSRVLNPALVLTELAINSAIVYANRRSLRQVAPGVKPLLWGVVPGVVAGSFLLSRAPTALIRVGTYLLLLPLIVAQTAGWRRPQLLASRPASAAAGLGIGALYGTTTISGPPLALLFNNRGLNKEEFRAALGLFRILETVCTAVTYFGLGLYARQSLALTVWVFPGVALGLFLGHRLLRPLRSETFRRCCMAFDGAVISFGLARALVDLHLVPAAAAYALFAAVTALELQLVVHFLRRRDPARRRQPAGADYPADYPIVLKLAARPVLLVGAGRVAELRLQELLAAGVDLVVVAPAARPAFVREAAAGRLTWLERSYRQGDCAGKALVLVAIDDLETSRAIASEARGLGIWVNAADLPELCDFNLPAIGRRGPVTVAVSTSGLAPALAGVARSRALAAIGPEYGLLARVFGRLRERLPGGAPRTALFRELLASDLLGVLARGPRRKALARLRTALASGPGSEPASEPATKLASRAGGGPGGPA